ncbi:GGDEF domain-containing protein [Mangrovibacter plantisponsor]|uniref:diguanylate cyclase n=1 Tax=Mangrovibacter plantisponsor TaxID=451513 RepID=A0A317PUN7_9ENTR|nr:GGDEF domain-containing protein [Mangrovibacter plantisponsor]PWW02710.1 diguanylate cyclase (GGDEF)-like protein [Mangrovibacter plantisponsor]
MLSVSPESVALREPWQQGFQQWHLRSKVPQIRYMAFLTAMLYFLYASIEYNMALNFSEIRLLVHGFIVPGTLLVISAMSYYPRLYTWMRLLLTIAPVCAMATNLWLNLGKPDFAFFAPEIYLCIFWTFTVSGLTLKYAISAASVNVLMALLMTVNRGVNAVFIDLHLLWITSAFLFGLLGGMVMEKAQKTLYLQQMDLAWSASRDSLTGLWNRAKMTVLFEQEKAQALDSPAPLSLIMLDIDHFKQVNDTFGHAAGDEVLIQFSRLLRDVTRPQDNVGRMGGEEFVILLPHTRLAEACNLARQLQAKIHACDFGTSGNVTASFGITQFRPAETFSDILERADRALYEAKKQGRDCLVSLT